MTQQFADNFAREWVEAWNAHDLDRVLSHYAENFEMSSPFIAQITGETSGTLKGKDPVRKYWKAALNKFPNLHFELQTVLVGATSIVLYYKTNFDRIAAEVLFFNENGLVERAAAHYGNTVAWGTFSSMA
jgi:hypothetical protein